MNNRLSTVIWEFTLKCNLRCSHCGSSAGISRKNELSTKECFKLCESLAELGCQDICLMGGEPFLREDWLSVAQCIQDLGMGLSFVSNGTILDQYISKIAALKPRVVGISLDGLQEAHESIRGKGTFAKTMAALDLLRANDIQTTVITTVSRLNFEELPSIRDLLYKKDINWQIQIAMPFGNFKADQMISPEDYYAVALFIAKQRIKNKFDDLPVIGAHCFGYFSKVFPPSVGWRGCTAGISSMGITSDGGIVGCLSMGNDRFVEGNVRDRDLKDIWQDPDKFAYNRKFDESMLGSNCQGCKHGKKCKGGCNSVSYSISQQFHNDPYCFCRLEKQIKI